MGSVIFVVFVILFVLFLAGVFSAGNRPPAPAADRRSFLSRATIGNPAARLAMQRAGYASGDEYAQVTDIGLLAYRAADEPRLVRQNAVATDTDYLRPFAALWVPHAARGMVRFEIVDNEARLRYADEMRYDLAQGDNTLLPGTWLPLRGKAIAPEEWHMRVLVGETLVAAHNFGWRVVGGGDLQRLIESDGEISPELQHAIRAQASQGMSLSELLADQDE